MGILLSSTGCGLHFMPKVWKVGLVKDFSLLLTFELYNRLLELVNGSYLKLFTPKQAREV